jgi:hypothetical protein
MSFSPSLAGVVAAAAIFSIGAAAASADAIPGPPVASPVAARDLPAGDGAGEYCPLRTNSTGHDAAGFATGVILVAIAARRRDPR